MTAVVTKIVTTICNLLTIANNEIVLVLLEFDLTTICA
jgi:hypothetical protein